VTEKRGLHQSRHAVSITRVDIVNTRQQTQQFVNIATLGHAQQLGSWGIQLS
jgi:hypothetical protein